MAPVNLHAIGAGHARHDGQITRFGAAHTGYIGDVCVGRRRRALHIVR